MQYCVDRIKRVACIIYYSAAFLITGRYMFVWHPMAHSPRILHTGRQTAYNSEAVRVWGCLFAVCTKHSLDAHIAYLSINQAFISGSEAHKTHTKQTIKIIALYRRSPVYIACYLVTELLECQVGLCLWLTMAATVDNIHATNSLSC